MSGGGSGVSRVLSCVLARPMRTLSIAVSVWAGAWCVYYAVQELKRGMVLYKRRRRFPLVQRRQGVPDAEWFGKATQRERANIRSRFRPVTFCGRYLNVTPEWREQGVWEWLWWKLVHSTIWQRGFGLDGGFSEDVRRPGGMAYIDEVLPVQPLDTRRFWRTQDTPRGGGSGGLCVRPPVSQAQGVSYVWLGQSTCLIQMHGVTILTDPVFGDQPLASVLSPRRMRAMPCTIEQVRHVDVILVSHNHYDHLDLSIVQVVPADVRWIVPTGVGALLAAHGVRRDYITELGWWDEVQEPCCVDAASRRVCRRLDVAAVPASHWSARTLWDTNRSLWNSYVVRCVAHDAPRAVSLFFCGDSGYSPALFGAIGRMYGPFDVAAIPIGSYEPRWHLSLQHMDPHGAVRVARDIGSRRAFGMHWGTWCMSGTYAYLSTHTHTHTHAY